MYNAHVAGLQEAIFNLTSGKSLNNVGAAEVYKRASVPAIAICDMWSHSHIPETLGMGQMLCGDESWLTDLES